MTWRFWLQALQTFHLVWPVHWERCKQFLVRHLYPARISSFKSPWCLSTSKCLEHDLHRFSGTRRKDLHWSACFMLTVLTVLRFSTLNGSAAACGAWDGAASATNPTNPWATDQFYPAAGHGVWLSAHSFAGLAKKQQQNQQRYEETKARDTVSDLQCRSCVKLH